MILWVLFLHAKNRAQNFGLTRLDIFYPRKHNEIVPWTLRQRHPLSVSLSTSLRNWEVFVLHTRKLNNTIAVRSSNTSQVFVIRTSSLAKVQEISTLLKQEKRKKERNKCRVCVCVCERESRSEGDRNTYQSIPKGVATKGIGTHTNNIKR
jgi:hypothetical protein